MASNTATADKTKQPQPWYAYNVFQGFKWTPKNTYAHSGIDLPMPVGTPLTSPVAGQIVGAGCHKWGVQIDIRFSSGGQTRVVSFLHAMQLAPGIAIGNTVQPGTLLGYSGGVSSGVPCPTDRAFTRGAHLHFELTAGSIPPYTTYNPRQPTATSYPINPMAFLAAIRTSGISGGTYGSPTSYTAADFANAFGNSLLGFGVGTNEDNDPGAGATAHALLVELPGFYGICAAIDAAEQFVPYKPPSGITSAVSGPGYTLTWLVKNIVAFAVRMGLMGMGFLILYALVLALININKWLEEAGGLVLPLAVAAM